jgi:hypothetical protein
MSKNYFFEFEVGVDSMSCPNAKIQFLWKSDHFCVSYGNFFDFSQNDQQIFEKSFFGHNSVKTHPILDFLFPVGRTRQTTCNEKRKDEIQEKLLE